MPVGTQASHHVDHHRTFLVRLHGLVTDTHGTDRQDDLSPSSLLP
jgi:hypothetical protein